MSSLTKYLLALSYPFSFWFVQISFAQLAVVELLFFFSTETIQFDKGEKKIDL